MEQEEQHRDKGSRNSRSEDEHLIFKGHWKEHKEWGANYRNRSKTVGQLKSLQNADLQEDTLQNNFP